MTLYRGRYRIESARLKGRDYGAEGMYYITICTRDRLPYLGTIKNGIFQPTSIGEIARIYWEEIPSHFSMVELDAYVVMPNHVHGIVIIRQTLSNLIRNDHKDIAMSSGSENPAAIMSAISPASGSLSAAIRSYKSAVTRWCGVNGLPFAWQERFHDNIIRKDALENIRVYIRENPTRWHEDSE